MIITFVHSTLPKQFGKILKNNVKITIIDQNSSQLNGNLIPHKIYIEASISSPFWSTKDVIICVAWHAKWYKKLVYLDRKLDIFASSRP